MNSEYQKHLEYVAKKLGCRLDQFDKSTPGLMYVEFGYVEGPTIEDGEDSRNRHKISQTRYLVNMHELGHFKYGHTQGRPLEKYKYKIPKTFNIDIFPKKEWYFKNGVLQSEAEAWNFAISNCIDQIKPESREYMWKCLSSYYNSAKNYGFNKPGRRFSGRGDRGYVQFKYGEPTDYFWKTKEMILG